MESITIKLLVSANSEHDINIQFNSFNFINKDFDNIGVWTQKRVDQLQYQAIYIMGFILIPNRVGEIVKFWSF